MMKQKKSHIPLYCVMTVVSMLGLAYASVPLYDLFCRVTGYGGTVQRVGIMPEKIINRDIVVRFDASLSQKMPWVFRAPEEPIKLKIGEVGLAFYTAYNPTDEAITGTATFNVTPQSAGQYFSKVDCFCFQEQTLEAKSQMDMPVTFFIDPEIVNDPDMDNIKTITLSYTFFRM